MRQRVAGHGQQFQRVVEGRGVGLPLEADRVELLQVVASTGDFITPSRARIS